MRQDHGAIPGPARAPMSAADRPPLVIRPAPGGEDARCGEIAASALSTTECPDRLPHARPELLDISPRPREGCTRYVAESGGVLVGFVDFDEPAGYVVRLYVDGRHQGHGVGSALLRAAEHAIAGVVSLTTLAVNDKALRWYLRRGYRITGGYLHETWAGVAVVWIELQKRPDAAERAVRDAGLGAARGTGEGGLPGVRPEAG